MNKAMLKDLAKTCWITLEDLAPWKDLNSAEAARAAKTTHQDSVLMLLKDQLLKCSDCSAVVAWMQLRGRGISPGDSATLFASAYQSCLDGSHIGQFLLGYMYGFLGPIFWEDCDSRIGMVGRNKVEAIRRSLFELTGSGSPSSASLVASSVSNVVSCPRKQIRTFGFEIGTSFLTTSEKIRNFISFMSEQAQTARWFTDASQALSRGLRDSCQGKSREHTANLERAV